MGVMMVAHRAIISMHQVMALINYLGNEIESEYLIESNNIANRPSAPR